MTDISRHPLLKQAYEVCLAIEQCGASPELTRAASRASDLLRALDDHLKAKPGRGDVSVSQIEATQGSATAFSIDPLESAIQSTAGLLRDERESGSLHDGRCTSLYDRLALHLDELLAVQVGRVKG